MHLLSYIGMLTLFQSYLQFISHIQSLAQESFLYVQLPVVNAVKSDFGDGLRIYIYITASLLVVMFLCYVLMIMKVLLKLPKWLEKLDNPLRECSK